MSSTTGLGTAEAIVLGAGIALVGSLINMAYQYLTTRHGDQKTRREERRQRIEDKVEEYAELMAKYWGSAKHTEEAVRQMESRSLGLKAYTARRIEIWCRDTGNKRGKEIRRSFQQMIFHAEGGSFQGTAHEVSHERATQVWTKAAALLSSLDGE